MTLTALTTLLVLAAGKGPPPTLRYAPPADSEDERPVVTAATLRATGNDFTFQLVFNHEPWGEACKTRCANATFFLDTDGNKTTGLQLGDKSPQTGADVAVIVQGVREYKEVSADTLLRAKVRLLASGTSDVEEGQTLAELDNRRDGDRLKAHDNEVSLRVDATAPEIPVGRTVRVVYQPPGAAPVVASIPGFGGGGGKKGPVQVMRGKRSR